MNGWAKAFLDRLLGSLCLIAALPAMVFIAIAIRATSRGPILFRQHRYGFNNEVIEVFKFRSMYTETLDQKEDRSVVRGDPRVTPLGAILRKTSLDELPQLFNVVFKGNLSLVGPRPHVPSGKVGDVPLRRDREPLLRASPCPPGHDGMGADQWLARIDDDAGSDRTACRVRSLLYREMVDLVRSLYFVADTFRCHLRQGGLLNGLKPRYARSNGESLY